jgi:tRNA(fMet)-specific endonuclease VapC
LKYLLDANSIISLLSGVYPNLMRRVADTEAGAIGVSIIAFAEVAHGSSQGKPPELDLLDAFIEEIPLVSFDENAARSYANIPFKRNSYDRLIAAQALSRGLTVVSRNTKDFADVPGLMVENWTV